MAQRIQCSCGKTFKVPEKFAGKKIRCLDCKQVLRLNAAPSATVKGLKAQGQVTCASCQSLYREGTRICLKCGIDLETGALVYSPNNASSEEVLDWSSEENFLQRRGLLRQIFDRFVGE